jgi:hypothetical protein
MQELQKIIKFSFMQTLVEPTLKDKIHFAISDIEDEKFLESIYLILDDKKKRELGIDDEHLALLKVREAKYLSGEKEAFTTEEVEAKIFAKYGF